MPVDWKYVERLFPPELIPEMPKTQEITPSGWRPPKGLYFKYHTFTFCCLDPAPNLPYYIRRSRYHMPELYLERRRDQLNPTTMLYEYVEVVALRGIFGDLFASLFFAIYLYILCLGMWASFERIFGNHGRSSRCYLRWRIERHDQGSRCRPFAYWTLCLWARFLGNIVM